VPRLCRFPYRVAIDRDHRLLQLACTTRGTLAIRIPLWFFHLAAHADRSTQFAVRRAPAGALRSNRRPQNMGTTDRSAYALSRSCRSAACAQHGSRANDVRAAAGTVSTRPSADPMACSMFFKPRGKLVSLDGGAALRVRNYMKRHNTEALTSDGLVAFTLHGDQLLECDPKACGQPPERLFVRFNPMHWVGECGRFSGAPEFVDVTEAVLRLSAQEGLAPVGRE
jgi:hypothetical protein